MASPTLDECVGKSEESIAMDVFDVEQSLTKASPTRSILKKSSLRCSDDAVDGAQPTDVQPPRTTKVSMSEDEPVVMSHDQEEHGQLDTQVSIRSKVCMSDEIEMIDCPPEEHPPSPDMLDISSLPNSMTFQNIFYEVTELRKFRRVTKTILNNVSGVMVPGINAILGPTGGGKTTLLDILAQRKGTSGLSQKIRGSVLLNGRKIPNNFKLLTGYVVQEDILEGILTVRENIIFSAALRLPRHVTGQERRERAEAIIVELGLTGCADTVVGTEFIRGVSGGERKRTVIGMELVINPSVLFLDEPTTGLDAHTAVSVIQSLQDWAFSTRTPGQDKVVIMSIHQPRYSIFKLFDSLTLLSLGSMVYQGKTAQALQYFERLGFGMEERENPADFFLDVINDSQSSIATHRRTIRKVKPKGKVDLVAKYRKSEESKNIDKQLEHANIELKVGHTKQLSRYLSHNCKRIPHSIYTFFWQILVLAVRSTISNFRNPATMLFQIVVMASIAIIVGVVYFQLDDSNFDVIDKHVSDRIGALFLIVLTQEFGVLSGFDLFISQRSLFIHENSSGFYRVSSYFVSKIITDIIPLRIIPIMLFSVIIYFMIGFQTAADKFFIFLLILSLGAVALSSFAFAISASIKNRSIAIVIFSLINLASILFGGIVISLSTLPSFLSWLQYLSVYSYVVQALAVNEISGVFYNATPVNGICSPMAGCLNGTLSLERNDFQTSTDYIWISAGALVGITVGVWCLTYVLLRCAKKHK